MRGSSAFAPDVEPSMPYELYAILVHSGGVGGGHYYAYIKSFVNDEVRSPGHPKSKYYPGCLA